MVDNKTPLQPPASQRRGFSPRYSLRNRLLLSFVVVAVISTLLLTVSTVYLQFQSSQKNAFDKLESVANLKEDAINIWVNSLATNLTSISVDASIHQSIVNTFKLDPMVEAGSELTADQASLKSQFSIYILENSPFDDIFLVDLKGDALVATDLSTENINRIRSDFPSYKAAVNGSMNSPIIRENSTDYRTSSSLILAVPIKDEKNQIVGIMGARASISRLYDIMSNLAGLGSSGETYLVGSDQKMVTATRFLAWKPYYYMSSTGVKTSLNKINGSSVYTNYRGTVFGVYHWLPSLEVVLMSEMDQSEAFTPAILTIQTSLLAALLAIILAALGSILVANSIATPVNDLVRVAKQIAAGDLTLRATVSREDEIGVLAEAFNSMTDQLRLLIRDLEQRVNARTAELEKRAVQIRAAGEVARDIAIAEDLSELLHRSVNLIRDRFGYYHAGLFLADDTGEYAILSAATGEAGRQMVEQGHKLKIGEVGIVGNVVSTGVPRIASDVGDDSLHFKNPLLPETHSEMALPLKVSGEVIGALDVQSQLISAFSKDDIDALQTMADQLAVAIQRAQLVQKLEDNIKELQASYQSYTKDAWHEFLSKSRKTYHLKYKQAEINEMTGHTPETLEVLSTNQVVIKPIGHAGDPQTAVAIPIQLRGHVLGVLNLTFATGSVNPDLLSLIENISNRMALSLDNARLLMEIRRRAEREHRISEITSKVRATTEIDKILRMAVEELGQVIGVSGAVIQLRTSESREETV